MKPNRCSRHGLAGACILDVDLMGVEGVWAIERLRRRDAKTPIIAYTADNQSEWEEEAFLHGVTHVLTKPVRSRLLNSLLERLWNAPATQRPAQTPSPAPMPSRTPFSRTRESSPPIASINASQTLDVLSDFSSILTHSLDAEAMLKQFLLFLREILSVNRAAIFLNRPSAAHGNILRRKTAAGCAPSPPSAFRRVCSNILNCRSIPASAASFPGSAGFSAATATRRAPTSRRKRNLNCSARRSPCPFPTAGRIAGVAVFDGRITGEPLVNVELELIFHLLEQVGLALRNIWLHDQLAGNHEMMTDVLRELSSACIVVGRDLKVLHANKAARRHFGQKNKRTGELEFSDLPQVLGAKIYQVLKTGAAIGPVIVTSRKIRRARFTASVSCRSSRAIPPCPFPRC